jgi:Rieske Fe-S protein
MKTPVLMKIVCTHCGDVRQAQVVQLKQVAKMYNWKHGKAKGTWVCPTCHDRMTATSEGK